MRNKLKEKDRTEKNRRGKQTRRKSNGYGHGHNACHCGSEKEKTEILSSEEKNDSRIETNSTNFFRAVFFFIQ